MTYGRFLEYLEMGWVKQVDLYDNSRNAIVQASQSKSTTVNQRKILWVLHNLSKVERIQY
jgi:hypothetical protein